MVALDSAKKGGVYIFYTRDDWLLKTHTCKKWNAQNWGLAMTLTREAAKLPGEAVAYRHCYISQALLAGVSVQVVEKNCGTRMEMISKH
ncbi:MAG: hypothetical protein GY712_04370 [Oceanicoccus sp.]|uniref:hypothetical protein n=1 Tax=Oceanicoccus sp. TaxID=2691044 RepID=UPI00262F882A|nr:hypothetical protein [Oceanicoccus sp.]MCP3907231.1 hypothetical protein [Oceanicoccus sp.]